MKKILFLAYIFIVGSSQVFAQLSERADVAMNGAFFSPNAINGCDASTLSIQFGNATANTQIPTGGITVYVNGPVGASKAYTFQSATPLGSSGMSWTFDATSNSWTGVNTAPILGGQNLTFDFKVDGTTLSTSAITTDVGVTPNASWTQQADNTQNNIVSPSATVTGICFRNTVTVTPNTTTVTQGTSVTLTASGCTGGTYTWTPTGGLTGGTGGSTYTISAVAGNTTYTATCSTGGTATATVTGIAPTCSANAGTLN